MRKALATLVAVTLGVALALVGTVALAARNSGGTYSRPSGNPVTTGTPISSTWANTLTADIASELTDSLSRSGKGPMLSALNLYSGGSATVPELTWDGDTDSGFYNIGADNVGLSLGGTKRWDFAAAGSTLTGTLDVSGTTRTTSLIIDMGGSVATTLSSSASANYTLFTPTALPASTLPVTLSAAGQLATGQITRAQQAALGQQISGSSGSFTTTSTTYVDVTNLTVTITTTGRPVLLMLQPADTTGGTVMNTNTTGSMWLSIVRDAAAVAAWYFSTPLPTAGSGVVYLDAPTAGTYTYKIQTKIVTAGTAYVTAMTLVAFEL